jgi:hypothetical protein
MSPCRSNATPEPRRPVTFSPELSDAPRHASPGRSLTPRTPKRFPAQGWREPASTSHRSERRIPPRTHAAHPEVPSRDDPADFETLLLLSAEPPSRATLPPQVPFPLRSTAHKPRACTPAPSETPAQPRRPERPPGLRPTANGQPTPQLHSPQELSKLDSLRSDHRHLPRKASSSSRQTQAAP